MSYTPRHTSNQQNNSSALQTARQTKVSSNLKIAIIILSIVLVCLVLIICIVTCSKNSNTEEEQDFEETTEQNQTPSSAVPVKSAAMQATETQINQLISQQLPNVAVAVLPVDNNSLGFNINGDDKFVSASMIKLLILANFINACDSGQLNCQSSYTLKSSDIVGGTGTIQNKGAGTSYTYDELAHYMIKCSDNTATNVLINTLGMNNINSTATSLGLSQTQLNRKMMDTSSGVENYISANDAALILQKIANKTLGSEVMCDKAIKYLSDQEDNIGLAQGLTSGINFAHKTGSLKNCRHDGGIVYTQSPYIIVCLCDIGASASNNLMQQEGKICAKNLG